ncbi:MAG: sensor histidine kinase [Leptolyngbya sp. BL-A-14]
MNWTDLVWLLLGLGLGLSLRLRSRQTISTDSTEKSSLPEPPLEQDPQSSLQSLQLAYQLATEISQFKGGFLARTSHELRSPLNGMIGMQQLILQDLCDGPEEERDFIAQANQSALKMIKVLDHVVDVARLQHGTVKMELQPLQLTALLQSVYDLTCLQAADRNLKLELTLPDPDLYVFADPRRLQQVLLYLVDTSIAEMGEGYIHVSAHPVMETECVQLWIDCDRPLHFSEPIDCLQTHSKPEAVIPSPGLNLLTSQILLSLMGGTLTVVESTAGSEQTRLQCTVPLVMPEPIA